MKMLRIRKQRMRAAAVLAAAMVYIGFCCTAQAAGSDTAQAQEQEAAVSGAEVRIGFYEDSEPLSYVGKGGTYGGIYIELLERVRENTGLNLVLYAMKREQNWKELLRSGEIDFYVGEPERDSEENGEFCMTEPLMEYTNLVVTRNDFTFHRAERTIIAMTDDCASWEAYLRERLGGELEIKYYGNTKECLLSVLRGDADASLINNLEFNYHLKNNRFSRLVRWPQYRFPTQIGLTALRGIDAALLSEVNECLRTLDADYTESVIEEGLNMQYQSYSAADRIFNAREPITVVLIVLFAGITVAVIYRVFRRRQRRLQEAVREREQSRLHILAALSRGYSSIYYMDLDRDSCEAVRLSESKSVLLGKEKTYSGILRRYLDSCVTPEFRETLLPFCDPKKIIQRFEKTKDFSIRYQVTPDQDGRVNYEMRFVDAGMQDGTHKMILGVSCIDEVVKEEQLRRQTLQDALDGANRANAAKSEFLSKMSHDIRTPMNAIIGMTTIAAAHTQEPEKIRDALAKISGASHHLLDLINNVLDMSKIEAGKMSLKEEPFQLTGMVSDTVDIMQPQITAHRHSLQLNLWDIRHKTVIGDSLRLQQALVNLLDNAVKYTPDAGQISLTVKEKEIGAVSCFEFTVKDSGIGMTPEIRGSIFDPFMRAEDQRISRIQGSGLGLPITLNIAQMMNGTVEVESEPGKGSAFTLSVFLQIPEQEGDEKEGEQEAEQQNEQFEKMTEGGFEGRRVLLAEDNPLNREIAAEILKMTGLDVEEAENGQEALTMFAESADGYYDMILMDIQMPVLNGHDAAREIRALERADAQSIPVIAMTANAFEEDIRASREAGMNEHLSKPVDFTKLKEILKKYLG